MVGGPLRRAFRLVVPRRIRGALRSIYRLVSGWYIRSVAQHLQDIKGQSITQIAQAEAQSEVMDLMLRRLRRLEDQATGSANSLQAQLISLAQQLESLEQQTRVIREKLPTRIVPLSEWEPWLVDQIRTQGDVFVDVGASGGQYSANLAPGYRQVMAFEPNPQARERLRIAVAGLENVAIDDRAVYSRSGDMKLYLYADDAQTSALPIHAEAMAGPPIGEIKVPCIRLDDLEIEGKLDFVKVDTEGAEVEVLAGALQTLRKHKPQLLLEVHNKENGGKIQDMLSDFGYRFTLIRHPAHSPDSPYWEQHYWLSSKRDVAASDRVVASANAS